MATTTTSIILLPDELQQATLSHVLAEAFVTDFFLSAPEWHDQDSVPPLQTLGTIARLSGVCTLWRQLVYSILRRALSPAGSITSPVVDPFPVWTVYGDTLRQLQARLRELRRRELDSYRDLVILPTLHQQPLAGPILTIGTPPMPAAPIAQTPPLPLPPFNTNTTAASAPLGGVPGVPFPAPAGAPIAILAAVPHSTATPHHLPAPSTTNNNGNATTNPLVTMAELHARADVFRRTYRGSGQPNCRVNQSLSIGSPQGADALTYIRRASALVSQLNIEEVGMALDLVLRETEDDIALGLRACEWQGTLQRLCTFPPWDQQAACEVHACLLEIERHVNAASLPLLQLSGLMRMVDSTSRASHILPVLVRRELIDCRAKAHHISMEWTSLLMNFDGYFWRPPPTHL